MGGQQCITIKWIDDWSFILQATNMVTISKLFNFGLSPVVVAENSSFSATTKSNAKWHSDITGSTLEVPRTTKSKK